MMMSTLAAMVVCDDSNVSAMILNNDVNGRGNASER